MRRPSKPRRIQTDCLSFMRCELSAVNSRCSALFPPQQRKAFHSAVLDEILQERVVSSRNRRNLRGVKRKMSNFPLRPRHAKPLPPIDIKKVAKLLSEQYCSLPPIATATSGA